MNEMWLQKRWELGWVEPKDEHPGQEGHGRQGTQNAKDHRAYCKLENAARPCGLKEESSSGDGRE